MPIGIYERTKEHNMKNSQVNRGRKQTKEHIEKRVSQFRGKKHYLWKDEVKYRGVHMWLDRNFYKGNECQNCGTKKSKRVEWANISGKYRKKRDDYLVLCTRCHNQLDKWRKLICYTN